MNKNRLIEKTFVKQQDSSDCGVACLRSIVRYWGGDISLERLRELSGTNKDGSTLLGLFETAKTLGFHAQGCKINISNLTENQSPTILHVLADGSYLHYIIWYGPVKTNKNHQNQLSDTQLYLIGDPAKGMLKMSEDQLLSIWDSKVCLILMPNEKFVKSEQKDKEKRKWFRDLIHEDIGLLVAAQHWDYSLF